MRTLTCAFVFLSVTAGLCFAQTTFSGNIQGVISDPTGASIPEATVHLRNIDTGVEATTATSSGGNYRFSSLAPGRYMVSVEAKGFKRVEENVTLETGETQGINLTLGVAAASETVSVLGEAPALDIDETRIQATLSAQTVRDLPSLNRNIWDVLSVAPGVVGAGTHAAGESPGGGADNFGTQTPDLSANGRSYTGNRVIVDGMDATSNIQNGNIIYAPPPDAVQEMSLQSNSWDAENNLGSSLLIQVTTKSGTNQFHGTGSYLFTNQDLLARTVFTPASYNPFKRQDLVGTFGGPIVRNKTFFFAETEALWSTTSTGNSVMTFESPQFVQWAQQNFPNTLGTKILQQNGPVGVVQSGVAQTAAQYVGTSCGTPAAVSMRTTRRRRSYAMGEPESTRTSAITVSWISGGRPARPPRREAAHAPLATVRGLHREGGSAEKPAYVESAAWRRPRSCRVRGPPPSTSTRAVREAAAAPACAPAGSSLPRPRPPPAALPASWPRRCYATAPARRPRPAAPV